MSRPGTSPVPRPRPVDALALAVGAAALGWALRPNVLVDDAAITLRYVERLASGHGLTYDAHEHVLGTSNPLYALVLSVPVALGADPEAAARGLGLALFVASVVLVWSVTWRLGRSRIAAAVAGVLVATDSFYRYQVQSGMEVGLSIALGLAVVVALLDERPVAAGVFLGLAVWNKLDAGLLAIAVAAAWLWVRRRPPFAIAAVAATVVLPWAVFATWYYGSPVPHSFVAKAFLQQSPVETFDHAWIFDFLRRSYHLVFPIGALLSPFALRGAERAERVASLALLLWLLAHFATFSWMSLGDYYPWYLTALIPPMIVLSCATAARTIERVGATGARAAAAAATVLLAVVVVEPHGPWHATYRDLVDGNPIKSWEAFDADRRLAGVFLDQYAEPDEIVRSAYGWPAYESKMPFDDSSLLNSRTRRRPAYLVESGTASETAPRGATAPEGFVALATFNLASDLHPGATWFTVFGTPDSSVARSGARLLQLRLFELPPPVDFAPGLTLENVAIRGVDLYAHPPSGATFTVACGGRPVHVVFTPSFAPDVPPDATDGVTFTVRSGGDALFERHVRPSDPTGPVVLRVPAAGDAVSISFVTGTGPAADPTYDWAIWRSVKLVVGDAWVDVSRLRSPKVIAAWTRYNPHAPQAP